MTIVFTRKIFLVALSISYLCILSAQGQSNKTQLQNQQKAIEQKLAQSRSLLKETSTKTKLTLNDLSLIKNQIENRKVLINSYSSEINLMENQIGNMSQEVDRLRRDLKQLKAEYAKLIYQSYKSRSIFDQWMFIFASKDFYQAYKRIKYLKDYARYRRQKANEINNTTIKINNNLNQLGVEKTGREKLLVVKEQEAKELEKDKISKEKAVKSLKSREKELRNEIVQQQKDWNKLNVELNRIIREEIAKAAKKENAKPTAEVKPKNGNTNVGAKPKTVGMAPEDVTLSNEFVLNQGKLPWPSERASISSHFGKHMHEELSVEVDNKGVDFTCENGDQARVVFAGKVSRIITLPKGYAVLVQHGSFYTVYSYLSNVSVREGQQLETKQKIGTIALDPLKKETLLHFELWKGTTIQNPESWLRR